MSPQRRTVVLCFQAVVTAVALDNPDEPSRRSQRTTAVFSLCLSVEKKVCMTSLYLRAEKKAVRRLSLACEGSGP